MCPEVRGRCGSRGRLRAHVPHRAVQLHPVCLPSAGSWASSPPASPPCDSSPPSADHPWGLIYFILLLPVYLKTASVYISVCNCGFTGLGTWGIRISSCCSLVRASSIIPLSSSKIRRIQIEEQINKNNFFYPLLLDSRLIDANCVRMHHYLFLVYINVL